MLNRSCTFSSGLQGDGDLRGLLKSVQDEHVFSQLEKICGRGHLCGTTVLL